MFVAGWRHALRSEWPFILSLLLLLLWDVKDMGQQIGFPSLEWNWPKEAMNMPIWAGIVDGAKLFKAFS